MTKEREALDMIAKLQMVEQTMEAACKRIDELKAENKALKEALAQPEQEPVARIAELEETVRQLNHALREATEAPTFMGEPVSAEPIARIKGFDEYGPLLDWYKHWVSLPIGTRFYTTPPQRTWVGLTPEEIESMQRLAIDPVDSKGWGFINHERFARLIEAKLKEKNT